jgi:hypothetical protein
MNPVPLQLQLTEQLTGGDVPHTDLAVVSSGDEPASVGREHDRIDRGSMSDSYLSIGLRLFENLAAGGGVPDLEHRGMNTAGSQNAAIGGEGECGLGAPGPMAGRADAGQGARRNGVPLLIRPAIGGGLEKNRKKDRQHVRT